MIVKVIEVLNRMDGVGSQPTIVNWTSTIMERNLNLE
jgi:hypothetical protein